MASRSSHANDDYIGGWTTVPKKRSMQVYKEESSSAKKSTSHENDEWNEASYVPVTYQGGNTIIHGRPNDAMKMRKGEYTVTKAKTTTNSSAKTADIDIRNLENTEEGPTLTYVSFALAKRIAEARNSYINPKTGANGITQQELANLVTGLSLADIKSVESTSAQTVYNGKLVNKICNKLGISASNS